MLLGQSATDSEIIKAWTSLSHYGLASRHIGCSTNGLHKIALTNPCSGLPLAMGRGATVAEAINQAIATLQREQ